jgi:hypothetical protein
MSDDRIAATSQALLDSVAIALSTEGLTVPSRRFTTTGSVALDLFTDDCNELFVVTWVRMEPEGGIGQVVKCAMPFIGRFVIGLFRCVPTLDDNGSAPTITDLSTSGEELATDAMTLAKVLVDGHLAGTLLPGRFGVVGIGDISAYGPSGGLGGVQATVFVELL